MTIYYKEVKNDVKVLILNGSPRENGNTSVAISEMEKIFAQENIEYETIRVGHMNIRGCLACGACSKLRKCVIDDEVNEIAKKFEAADGLVVASLCQTRIIRTMV